MKRSKFSEIQSYGPAREACRASHGRRVDSRRTSLVIRLDNGRQLLATKIRQKIDERAPPGAPSI